MALTDDSVPELRPVWDAIIAANTLLRTGLPPGARALVEHAVLPALFAALRDIHEATGQTAASGARQGDVGRIA